MTDYRDDELETSIVHDRLPFVSPAASRLLTGAAIGAALGAFAAFCFKRSSEEPPIRVKGGSTIFEILSANVWWEPEGSRRTWRLSEGEKQNSSYTVKLTVKEGGRPQTTTHVGDVVRVYVDQNSFVEFKAHGNVTKRTKVHSNDHDLVKPVGLEQNIVHPQSIHRIQVGVTIPYFAADAEFVEMIVCHT